MFRFTNSIRKYSRARLSQFKAEKPSDLKSSSSSNPTGSSLPPSGASPEEAKNAVNEMIQSISPFRMKLYVFFAFAFFVGSVVDSTDSPIQESYTNFINSVAYKNSLRNFPLYQEPTTPIQTKDTPKQYKGFLGFRFFSTSLVIHLDLLVKRDEEGKIRLRPNARQFLALLPKEFDILLASSENLTEAKELFDALDPEGRFTHLDQSALLKLDENRYFSYGQLDRSFYDVYFLDENRDRTKFTSTTAFVFPAFEVDSGLKLEEIDNETLQNQIANINASASSGSSPVSSFLTTASMYNLSDQEKEDALLKTLPFFERLSKHIRNHLDFKINATDFNEYHPEGFSPKPNVV